jgi:hypothetical protein
VSQAQRERLEKVVAALAADAPEPSPAELADAARTACALLAIRYPGGFVELRVPPYAAVQLGIGDRGRHTRGTPPNVVQTDAVTLLRLAGGLLTWPDAMAGRLVQASGVHSDLGALWPLAELA